MVVAAQAAPVSWSPIRSDEFDSSSNTDKLGSRTWVVQVQSLTGLAGNETTDTIWVSVFAPKNANWERPKVHVFFGPGNAVEKGDGLTPDTAGGNAVMVHGFRGSSEGSEWILIGVPGRSGEESESNGFYTISDAAIKTCLGTAGVFGARTFADTTPAAIRFSAHSRGYRGLRETIKRNLVTGTPERVVVFDAAYTSLDDVLRASGIPGRSQFAYLVTVRKDQRTPTSPQVDAKLTSAGATNVYLDPNFMRAIGYCRLVEDANKMGRGSGFGTMSVNLVPRTQFTTRTPTPSGMTDINQFVRSQTTLLNGVIATDTMRDYIATKNLVRFGPGKKYTKEIEAHHFFVAELAHEVVD